MLCDRSARKVSQASMRLHVSLRSMSKMLNSDQAMQLVCALCMQLGCSLAFLQFVCQWRILCS